MKRISICLFLLLFLVSLPQVVAAGWINYKLIKDGVIDETKWRIVDDSAAISASDDGKWVKFEPRSGWDNESAWLTVAKCPEKVKGLEVTMKMGEDVTSHLFARISTVLGAYGPENYYLWSQLSARRRDTEGEVDDRLFGNVGASEWPPWQWVFDPTYNQFAHPIEVAGKTFKLKMVCDKNKITYSVDGYGSATYTFPGKLKAPYEYFWGMGTRSPDGLAEGTVYFHKNVRLLVKGNCDEQRPKIKSTYPADEQRRVSVNLEKIDLIWKEPMNGWNQSWHPPFECQQGDPFSYPNKFTCRNAGDPLEYNKRYEVCLDKNGFYDLAGNGNREYCFWFKTEKEPVAEE
jgi:hypothetical protein